ncbi:hypothetical protein BWK59_09485 [Flavobacterium davisii]|uniref:Uncharacterized protein n=1 Tax=Flavobacterium davisii TaxID=2906077 RepID=A0A2D0AIK4_9FLAO|nr:hypothetical protein [Flavobacterium davisii]OWP83641.1 hypothetical protein BWK59_09485 [Flavobacterium davisii]
MWLIDLNTVKYSFTVFIETLSKIEQGKSVTTLKIGEIEFSTEYQTTIDTNTYMLHHLDESNNKAYLLLTSKLLD